MIADELYRENIDGHEQYTIIWKDTYLEGDTHPMSTEFIVGENESSGKDDDFLYKVVIFLTTGKIMAQGKTYNKWCKEHFQKCRERINGNEIGTGFSIKKRSKADEEHDESVTESIDETGDMSADKFIVTLSEETQVKSTETISEETYVKEIITESEPTNMSTANKNKENHEKENDDHIDLRMDVFEDKLLEISNKDNKLDRILTKVNALEEIRIKDK